MTHNAIAGLEVLSATGRGRRTESSLLSPQRARAIPLVPFRTPRERENYQKTFATEQGMAGIEFTRRVVLR